MGVYYTSNNSLTIMEVVNSTVDELSMFESTQSVFELNQEEVTRLAPLLTFLAVIGFFGIPGNAFVIYAFRYSCRRSNSHLFFVWLAMIDLFNCSIILPFEFVNVVNQYTYDNAWLCKMTISLTIWPTLTSGLTLTVISIDRYRKVCRPLKWQFSNRTARLLCLATFIVALLFSWPALILFGLHRFDIVTHNMTGTDCAITDEYESTLYVRIYNGFLWILFVSTFSIIILLYIIIGRQIFKQMSKIKRLTRTQSELLRARGNRSNPDLISEDTTSMSVSYSPKEKNIYKSVDRSLSSISQSKVSTAYEESIERRISHGQAKARKSALIMFLISLAFVVSYLPYLILRLKESMAHHFVLSMTDIERALYKTFLRTYWFNCAINPFIYCACAPQFRSQLKDVLNRIRRHT